MLDPLHNAELFLVTALFDIFLFLLTMRLILCWVRADYFNPATRFVVRCTQPLIGPLRRVFPTYAHVELSTLIVILVFAALKFFLISLILIGVPKNPLGLLTLSLADTLRLLLNTFFYAILFHAILSWVQQSYSPVGKMLMQISSPVIRPIQRIVPPIGGMDISPIPALIVLRLLVILLVEPSLAYGMRMVYGS